MKVVLPFPFRSGSVTLTLFLAPGRYSLHIVPLKITCQPVWRPFLQVVVLKNLRGNPTFLFGSQDDAACLGKSLSSSPSLLTVTLACYDS